MRDQITWHHVPSRPIMHGNEWPLISNTANNLFLYVTYRFFSLAYQTLITIFGSLTFIYSRHGFYKYVLFSFFHLFLQKSIGKGTEKYFPLTLMLFVTHDHPWSLAIMNDHRWQCMKNKVKSKFVHKTPSYSSLQIQCGQLTKYPGCKLSVQFWSSLQTFIHPSDHVTNSDLSQSNPKSDPRSSWHE